LRLEFVGQQVSFFQRFQNGLTALVKFRQLVQTVANAGEGDLVQRPGRLFAVTGYERNGGAFGEKSGHGLHLNRREL